MPPDVRTGLKPLSLPIPSARESVQIDDVDTAILRPGRLGMSGHRRTLLTVAYGGDLRIRHALQHQRLPHRLGTPLAETDIVFARATLIGVAFQTHTHARIGGQVFGVRRQYRVVVRLDLAAVKIE